MKKTQIPDWLVCQAIEWWLNEKDITLADLARKAGYLNVALVALIERRVKNREALPTDFLCECVDVFGLKIASRAKFEDTADTLTDDEYRELLIQPLRQKAPQRRFWK